MTGPKEISKLCGGRKIKMASVLSWNVSKSYLSVEEIII